MWLGLVAATLAKIATEIAMLMRTEIDEVREPFESGRGASSTLPQKRNPVSCQPVIAIAKMAREKVGLALDAIIQDHERATGAMHLE
jgi:3-carboxy-cis,cis-muconate cycloisomerase